MFLALAILFVFAVGRCRRRRNRVAAKCQSIQVDQQLQSIAQDLAIEFTADESSFKSELDKATLQLRIEQAVQQPEEEPHSHYRVGGVSQPSIAVEATVLAAKDVDLTDFEVRPEVAFVEVAAADKCPSFCPMTLDDSLHDLDVLEVQVSDPELSTTLAEARDLPRRRLSGVDVRVPDTPRDLDSDGGVLVSEFVPSAASMGRLVPRDLMHALEAMRSESRRTSRASDRAQSPALTAHMKFSVAEMSEPVSLLVGMDCGSNSIGRNHVTRDVQRARDVGHAFVLNVASKLVDVKPSTETMPEPVALRVGMGHNSNSIGRRHGTRSVQPLSQEMSEHAALLVGNGYSSNSIGRRHGTRDVQRPKDIGCASVSNVASEFVGVKPSTDEFPVLTASALMSIKQTAAALRRAW